MTELLKEELEAWDGIKMEYLTSIYRKYANRDQIDLVIQIFLNDPSLQVASSWLLKHHIDEKAAFTKSQMNKILLHLEELNEWAAQLHILQIIPHTGLTRNQAVTLEPIISKAMQSDRKFVRAAAFEAYFEVVKNIQSLQNEFHLHCEDSLEKEPASVKVKIRRILEKLPLKE